MKLLYALIMLVTTSAFSMETARTSGFSRKISRRDSAKKQRRMSLHIQREQNALERGAAYQSTYTSESKVNFGDSR